MSVDRPGNSRGGARGSTRRRALGAIGAGAVLGVAARPAGPWPAGAVWAAPLPLSGRAQAPAQTPAQAAAQAVVYFPETGHHLQAGFLEHWRRHQGPARLGPPVSEEQWDAGVGGMVQQFQLARLEWRRSSRPVAPPSAVREVMEGAGAGAGVAGGGGRVPRAPGVPDWTAALAPPAPRLTATADPTRPGRAIVVAVESDDPAGPLAASGSLAPLEGPAGPASGTPLRLFPAGEGRHLGVAALGMGETPRPWTLKAVVRNALGLEGPPSEAVLQVVDGGFPLQRLVIQSEIVPLLNPDVGRQENLTIAAVMASSDPEPLWRGPFLQPVSGTLVTVHGARRTYVGPDGEAVSASQHGGVDLGVAFGTPILSPAAGVVAFAGAWSIRGNVVVLDHGAGVHSVHAHASSIAVAPGQRVSRGQTLGRIGSTGLSTGPHLHWEVRVGGIAVDPLEWTRRPDLAIA